MAPFIAQLGVADPSLPFLIFGLAAVVGGLGAVMLPETRGSALPTRWGFLHTVLVCVLLFPVLFHVCWPVALHTEAARSCYLSQI